MSRFSRLLQYRRSLVFQLVTMSLLAVIALVAIVIYNYGRLSPVFAENAFNAEYQVLDQARQELSSTRPDFSRLLRTDYFQRVMAKNRGFRFYVRNDRIAFGYGRQPRKFERPIRPPLPVVQQQGGQCSPYASGNYQFVEHGLPGRVYYSFCANDSFYGEVVGLVVAPRVTWWERFVFPLTVPLTYFWSELWAGVAILLVAALILFSTIKSLRKVARVTGEIDLGKNYKTIDGTDLPFEVQPLIRSINTMVNRIQDNYERNSFFLAAAAHELKTPLALMRARVDEAPDEELRSAVRRDTSRMTALTNGLLDLVRYRSLTDLKTERFDLVASARNVSGRLVNMALDRRIELEFESGSDMCMVEADRRMAETAISNLIDNAISFSEPYGTVTVKVVAPATIEVHDSGPGVAQFDERELFEPFRKEPSNRIGHGLGLAIVQAIMEVHGGTAAYRDSEGNSAIFLLTFPNR